MNVSHTNIKVQKQKEHFEAVSEDYYEATQHPNCIEFNRLIWSYFLQRHREILPKGASVLEPMCGHGIAMGHLADNLHSNFQYTGFDYSEPLVDVARQRMPGGHVFVQDVTTFEPTKQYDLIFLAGGLHHVYEQTEEVLTRLRHALAPGGHMLSAEPTYHNVLYNKIGGIIYKRSEKFEHESEQRYGLPELNGCYKGAGFTIVDQCYPGLIAYVIAVSAFCFPRFCIGSPRFIRLLTKAERPMYHSWLGRKLSFSTMTLLKNDQG